MLLSSYIKQQSQNICKHQIINTNQHKSKYIFYRPTTCKVDLNRVIAHFLTIHILLSNTIISHMQVASAFEHDAFFWYTFTLTLFRTNEEYRSLNLAIFVCQLENNFNRKLYIIYSSIPFIYFYRDDTKVLLNL